MGAASENSVFRAIRCYRNLNCAEYAGNFLVLSEVLVRQSLSTLTANDTNTILHLGLLF